MSPKEIPLPTNMTADEMMVYAYALIEKARSIYAEASEEALNRANADLSSRMATKHDAATDIEFIIAAHWEID